MSEDIDYVDAIDIILALDNDTYATAVEANSMWHTDTPAYLRYLDRVAYKCEQQLRVARYMRRQALLDLTLRGFSKTEAGRYIALKRTRSHELVEQAKEERLQKVDPF